MIELLRIHALVRTARVMMLIGRSADLVRAAAGRGARGRGDGHNERKGRGLPAPPRVGLKPVVADQMTISR